jgi:hypothetical protein
LWFQDRFRVYAEFITAQSLWQDLAPLPIDVNKADMQNLFIDVKLFDIEGYNAYARFGRQEMLLGSQRLISPLDWANTRRTFNGVRAFRQGENFDVDLFWVQPVIPNADRFDSVDRNQQFAGAWATYRPEKGHFLDFYYLFYDNANHTTQQSIVRYPANMHTIGTRYAGDRDHFLWEFEGALQFGERGSQDLFAGMGTAGVGYNFADAPWKPTVWAYYDYASGSNNPGTGTFSTFNQLFPFGHYYFGGIDQIGRQNIQDLNAHLYVNPENWLTINLQYHHLWLAQSRDALYNSAGNAIRRSATGAAGNDVGDEAVLNFNFHLTKHSDLMTGYIKLFGGRFMSATAGTTGATNTDLFYLCYSYKW